MKECEEMVMLVLIVIALASFILVTLFCNVCERKSLDEDWTKIFRGKDRDDD